MRSQLFHPRRALVTGLFFFCFLVGGTSLAQTDRPSLMAKRSTVAIKYLESEGTSIDMAGTASSPRVRGKAEVKRKQGTTRIRLEISELDHPQALSSYYTTYVLWAVAPEGQADNLGELQVRGPRERELEVTTKYQTFGLIITAEPHALVRLPGPTIVAENILREHTKGGISSSQIEYRGDSGAFYALSDSPIQSPDYTTPLSVLGARRAVDIAMRAGARRYAEREYLDSQTRLAALEATWQRRRADEKLVRGEAQEVIRLAEQARALSVERQDEASLAAERRAANRSIAEAQSEADRAGLEADRAKEEAAGYRAALQRSESELVEARKHVEQAQTEAERAKANEELARVQADRARIEANEARQQRDAAQQRLFVSLSAILETRREARGLIVSLSDVLFDFNEATLKPGAKEKLSKLAGILLAYSTAYRMDVEGHTDAVGSDQYNQKLSEARANAVRDYLVQAGLPAAQILSVRGFGKAKPVATNDTPEGRQMNRRVELVIADAETAQQSIIR